MKDANQYDSIQLFAVKEDISANRKREQTGAQVLPATSTYAGSLRQLSGLDAQTLNKAPGSLRVVLPNMEVDFLQIRPGMRRDGEPRHMLKLLLLFPKKLSENLLSVVDSTGANILHALVNIPQKGLQL